MFKGKTFFERFVENYKHLIVRIEDEKNIDKYNNDNSVYKYFLEKYVLRVRGILSPVKVTYTLYNRNKKIVFYTEDRDEIDNIDRILDEDIFSYTHQDILDIVDNIIYKIFERYFLDEYLVDNMFEMIDFNIINIDQYERLYNFVKYFNGINKMNYKHVEEYILNRLNKIWDLYANSEHEYIYDREKDNNNDIIDFEYTLRKIDDRYEVNKSILEDEKYGCIFRKNYNKYILIGNEYILVFNIGLENIQIIDLKKDNNDYKFMNLIETIFDTNRKIKEIDDEIFRNLLIDKLEYVFRYYWIKNKYDIPNMKIKDIVNIIDIYHTNNNKNYIFQILDQYTEKEKIEME